MASTISQDPISVSEHDPSVIAIHNLCSNFVILVVIFVSHPLHFHPSTLSAAEETSVFSCKYIKWDVLPSLEVHDTRSDAPLRFLGPLVLIRPRQQICHLCAWNRFGTGLVGTENQMVNNTEIRTLQELR
jgi:hypothetical protein